MPLTKTDLICSSCVNIFPIWRKRSYKEKNHVKHLWCHHCLRQTPHIEIRDSARYKKELEFKPILTEQEQFILNLLNHNDNNIEFEKVFQKHLRK